MKPMISRLVRPIVLFITLVTQLSDVQAVSQQELQRRVEYADKQFATRTAPGSKTDRGRAYIVLGPPDQISVPKPEPNADSFPVEEWTYRAIPGVGTNVCVLFVDPNMNNSFKMAPYACRSDSPADAADRGAKRRYELIRRRIKRELATLKQSKNETR